MNSLFSTTFKRLTAKLAAFMLLAGMCAPMSAIADDNTGTLTIHVTPQEGTYQVVDDVTGETALSTRSGSTSISGFPAGDYRIEYQPIDNHATPDNEAFTLPPGGAVTLYGNYEPITHNGTLNVVVSPDQGAYEVFDDATNEIILNEHQGSQSFTIPFGDYVVRFKDIGAPYVTPEDQEFSLGPGNLEATVTGIYDVPSNQGTLNVNVSPAQGRYEIRDDVTDSLVIAETEGSESFNLPFGDYVVKFQEIGDPYVIVPEDQEASLTPQTPEMTVYGEYQTLPNNMGVLTVIVSPGEGTYNVEDDATGLAIISNAVGTQSFNIPFGDYVVKFQEIGDPYVAPADEAFSLSADNPSVTVTGIYTTEAGNGSVVVNVLNQDYEAITDGDWTLSACSGDTLNTCTEFFANGDRNTTLSDVPAGTYYGLSAELTPGYQGRVILGPNPALLNTGGTLYFTVVYMEDEVPEIYAGIQVSTTPVSGTVTVNGNEIGTTSGNADEYIPAEPYQIDVTQENVISFSQENGYTKPGDIVIPANSLEAGQDYEYTGTYTQIDDDYATLSLTTVPVVGEIFVDGASVGEPANPGALINFQVDEARDYVVSFGDAAEAGYTTPPDQTVTVTQAHLEDHAIIPVTGTYIQEDVPTATIRVETNIEADVSVDGTVIGTASPGNPAETLVDIREAHTITFEEFPGQYITPPPISIAADELEEDSVNDYTGTYIVLGNVISVEKTATEAALPDNNKRITYEIKVTRLSSGDPVTVSLSDSITGSGTLINNGGTLNIVPNTYRCEGTASCTNAAADGIAVQPTEITLEAAGTYATVIYEMTSNNSGQTVSANFVNVATATYVNPETGETEAETDDHIVTVSAPVSDDQYVSPGGGGGGGGHLMYTGDMELIVEKLVSLDGVDYQDASTQDIAIVIPENENTRLYYKVLITNPGPVSAKDIKYLHFFDEGDSDMTAGSVEDLEGADIDNDGDIHIEKITVNETAEFTYSVLVHENGQNSNPAIDGLELVDFGSTLSRVNDSLTYAGIGNQFVTYIYAGRIPAAVIQPEVPRQNFANASEVLAIRVDADRAEAAIGETVNYTVTLENVSDTDLSNLFIAHSYPAELSVVNSGGGRDDGREIHFQRPILRPGETATFQFSLKVIGGNPGSMVRSLTRAMVNEFENISPAESFLLISGGAAAGQTDPYRLVQTGPMGILLLLIASVLAYFGYGVIQKRRYLKLKKAALEL